MGSCSAAPRSCSAPLATTRHEATKRPLRRRALAASRPRWAAAASRRLLSLWGRRPVRFNTPCPAGFPSFATAGLKTAAAFVFAFRHTNTTKKHGYRITRCWPPRLAITHPMLPLPPTWLSAPSAEFCNAGPGPCGPALSWHLY